MSPNAGMASRALTFLPAGGRGEGLYPLTQDRAKPLVSFGGIYRPIDFTLSNCFNSGLRWITVLTQYQCESLQSHVRALLPQTPIHENVHIADGVEVGYDLSRDREYGVVTDSGVVVIPANTCKV